MLDDGYGAPTEGWGWVDNSQVANNGDQTVTVSVLDNSTSTQGPDQWGGFFRQLIGQGVNYAINKDAVTSGVAPRYGTSASGQPVYMGQPVAQQGMGKNTMILALGVVGVVLVLAMALRKG